MWSWEFLVISCMAHVLDVKQYFIRYLNIIFYHIEMWCDLGSSSKLMYGSCIRYKVTFYSICILMCYLMHTSGIGCKVMILFCLFLSCFRMLIGGRAFLSSSGRAILNSWYASSETKPQSFATSTRWVISSDELAAASSSTISASPRGIITSSPSTLNLIWKRQSSYTKTVYWYSLETVFS